MHFFSSLFFSLGPEHSLFLFPLSPSLPVKPSPTGFSFFFLSARCSPAAALLLLFPARRPTPAALSSPSSLAVSGARLSGSSSSSTQTRARVRPWHSLHSRGVPGLHTKPPRPPYKAAAPRPRSRKTRAVVFAVTPQ
jgi:hypothetical protein